MSNPRNMIKKSLLLSTIMAAKDIRQWRAIVVASPWRSAAAALGRRSAPMLLIHTSEAAAAVNRALRDRRDFALYPFSRTLCSRNRAEARVLERRYSYLMPPTTVVTGAAGRIGRGVSASLRALGHRVVGIDVLPPPGRTARRNRRAAAP